MSNAGIFLIGSFVTLLVAGALTLIVLGAVMDGRRARLEVEEGRRDASRDSRPAGAPASAPRTKS